MTTKFQIGTTPNPNALRIGLSEAIFDQAATYKIGADTAGRPLVAALLAIVGISQVFTLNNFITITKDATADWGAIEPLIGQALMDHLNG